MTEQATELDDQEPDDQPMTTWQLIVEAQAQRRVDLANRLFGSDNDGDDNNE